MHMINSIDVSICIQSLSALNHCKSTVTFLLLELNRYAAHDAALIEIYSLQESLNAFNEIK